MTRKVWHNGKIIDEQDAKVSIYDEALQFGTVAFEMMRTFGKRTFRLNEHLKRLQTSCDILEIDTSEWNIRAAHELLLHWHIVNFPEVEEWRLLINVSRGTLPLYQNMLQDDGKPNVMIACFPLKEILLGMSWVYDGVKAIVPNQRALPHHLLDSRLKTRSRQHLKVANLEVEKIDKHAFPLLLDPDGFVAESTGSNFFMVKDGALFTPHGRNCLRGISRQYVKEIANYPTIEENITVYDVITAEEAFFTNTPYSIIPCTSINGHKIGDGKVGKITTDITDRWIRSVHCNFIYQAIRWDKEV